MIIGFTHFPRIIQLTDYTCGPCAVYAVVSHFGSRLSYRQVKVGIGCDRNGSSERRVIHFLRKARYRVCVRDYLRLLALRGALERGYIVLVSLDGDHYGVVYGYDTNSEEVLLSDPSIVRQPGRRISARRFIRRWDRDGLLVRPRTRGRCQQPNIS